MFSNCQLKVTPAHTLRAKLAFQALESAAMCKLLAFCPVYTNIVQKYVYLSVLIK